MTHEEVFSYNKHTPEALEKPYKFAAVGLAHGHVNNMCTGMLEAGATLAYVYDDNKALIEGFLKRFPGTPVAESYEQIFAMPDIELIVSADIPSHRADVTVKAMKAGKDAFIDKAPLLTLEELAEVKKVSKETGKKLFVSYSEFMHNEAAIFAKQLIDRGVIGKVCHVDIFAPHRLNPPSRPEWFWSREDTGGVLIDIGSHQFLQFLAYSGCNNATVNSSRIGNYFNQDHPGLDDFGDATLTAENGITGYVRIDWLSPKGINTWGDGRVIILGSDGYIELRKNCDIGKDKVTDTVYVCTEDGVFTESVKGKVGYPFFSALINDSRNGTSTAMPEEQTYNAIELAIKAQMAASEK